MRLSLLIISLVISLATQAQYFQHLYGGARTQLFSGENVYSSPQVTHVMGGVQTNNDLVVTACDAQGGFSNPGVNFNNTYHVTDPSGIQVALHGAQVFKLQGPGYGVVALSELPGSSTPGIVYFSLDDLGNVSSPANEYTCNITGTGWKVSLVMDAMQASNSNIYIIGTVVDPALNGNGHPFVLSLSPGGAMNWFVVNEIGGLNQNTIVRPDAITENPWANQMILVGGINELNGPNYGFFMPIDKNTGVCTRSEIYGNYTYDCALTSIDVANNPAPNGNGFVLGGWTTKGNSGVDMWLTKVDPTGQTVDWSYQYDYHTGNGSSEFALDVKERLNTMGMYEYYLAGYTDQGINGNIDALVLKLDDVGLPTTNGEFTYGSATNEEIGKRIDLFDGTSHDGISLYASEYEPGTNRSDMLLVKAYFNGYTACDYNLDNSIQTSGPPHDRSADMLSYGGWNSAPLTVNSFITKDIQRCFTNSVVGGDNTSMPMNTNSEDVLSSKLLPNPYNNSYAVLTIEHDATERSEAIVSIYDMLGKQYVTYTLEFDAGTNTVDLDLSSVQLAQGVYTVKIIGKGLYESHTLLVD